MDLTIVSTAAGLADLRETWEDLEDRDPHAPFYVHHRFASAWWSGFAPRSSVDLHVVCVRNNNRVVAIAPFAIRRTGARGTGPAILEWATHGDYRDLLIDPDANVNADTVCKVLLRHVIEDTGCHRVNLAGIPTTGPFAHYLLKSSRHNDHFRHHVETPWIDLTRHTDFDAFESACVPKTARQYRNKLLRDHDVTFRIVRRSTPDLLARIAALHRVEKEYLTDQGREGRRSLFEDESRYDHLEQVFTDTDDAVTFLYETADGDLVGYRTCWLHDRVLLSWNSAWNPDYKDYRVGKAIQYDILRALFEDRFADRFDFGAGRYPWKFEWTGDFTSTYRLAFELAESDPPTDFAAPGSSEPTLGAAPSTNAGASATTDQPSTEEAPTGRATGSTSAATSEPATAGRRSAQEVVRETAAAARETAATVADRLDWRRVAHAVLRTPRSRRRAEAVRDRVVALGDVARGRAGPDDTAHEATSDGLAGGPASLPGPVHVWYVPHPDDEALFMAACMAANRDGTNVAVLLTRGGASRAVRRINARLDHDLGGEEFMTSRVREFEASTTHLGVRPEHRIVHDHPDGALDVIDVRAHVTELARRHPDAVHHAMSWLDPHPDHRASGEALRAAAEAGEVIDCVFHVPVSVLDDTVGDPVAIGPDEHVAKQAALGEYGLWAPHRGRYAVGSHSVDALMSRQVQDPTERTHGPDHRG